MKLIPAIDIMNKQVVRLTRGDENTVKSYETLGTPLEVASFWSTRGAEILHIIDLDAALSRGDNWDILKLILDNLDVPIQIGGGIRNIESAQRILEHGAERIIIGSMALMYPKQTLILLEEYGKKRIVIALDHIQSKVLRNGWKKFAGTTLERALKDFKSMGFEWFLVTDANRDGTLEGPNVELYSRVSGIASIIASGGVKSLMDLKNLKGTGVNSVVIGKALYENRFTFVEALKFMEALCC